QCRVVAINEGGRSDPALSNELVPTGEPPPPPPAGGVPSVPDDAQSGDTVSCDPGGWSGEPTSFEYTWLRNGAAIAGATSDQYTLTAADVGQTIQCRVVA